MILFVLNSSKGIIEIMETNTSFQMHFIVIFSLMELQKTQLFPGPNEFDGQKEAQIDGCEKYLLFW